MKNSIFKHSYRDEVENFRSALMKGSRSSKFYQISSKLSFIRAKTMTRREFAGGCFTRARAAGPERVFDQAARGSNPVRFSSYVLLCLSHLVRASGHGEETTTQQQHDSVVQGPPCHHRAQGSSVNPFGYPPLSDIYPLEREKREGDIPRIYP